MTRGRAARCVFDAKRRRRRRPARDLRRAESTAVRRRCGRPVAVPRAPCCRFAGARDGIARLPRRRRRHRRARRARQPVDADLRSRLGGFEGRALATGRSLARGRAGRDALTAGRCRRGWLPAYGHGSHRLRVVMGPQDDAFTRARRADVPLLGDLHGGARSPTVSGAG